MEVHSVVQKEAPMGVPKADRSVVLRVDRMEAHSVVPMEGPRVDWKVDRTEVLRVVRREDRSEVPKVGRSGARMEVQRVARSEDRTGEGLEGSGRMAEPVEVLPRMQVGVVGARQRFPL